MEKIYNIEIMIKNEDIVKAEKVQYNIDENFLTIYTKIDKFGQAIEQFKFNINEIKRIKIEKYKQTEKNKTIEDFKRIIANYFSYSSYDLFYSNLVNTGIKGTIQNTFADMILFMEKQVTENEDLKEYEKQ